MMAHRRSEEEAAVPKVVYGLLWVRSVCRSPSRDWLVHKRATDVFSFHLLFEFAIPDVSVFRSPTVFDRPRSYENFNALTFTLTPTTRSLQDIQADHDSSRSNTRTCFRLVHIFSLCYSPYSNSNFTSLRASIEPSIIKLHLSLSLVATEQTGPSRELCCHAFYIL